MNYKPLNEAVQYIESNLDKEIDFDKLSKITGMNNLLQDYYF